MKIKFHLGIGLANADHEEVFEFPDGTPEGEINEAFEDWKCNYMDDGWWPVEEDE